MSAYVRHFYLSGLSQNGLVELLYLPHSFDGVGPFQLDSFALYGLGLTWGAVNRSGNDFCAVRRHRGAFGFRDEYAATTGNYKGCRRLVGRAHEV